MSSLEQEAVILMKKLDRQPSEVCMTPVSQSLESSYLREFSDLGHVRPAGQGWRTPPEGRRRDRIVILEWGRTGRRPFSTYGRGPRVRP